MAAALLVTPSSWLVCTLPFILVLMWRRALAVLAPRRPSARAASTLPPCAFTPPPYAGPPKSEVLALRKQFLNPGESERREPSDTHHAALGVSVF